MQAGLADEQPRCSEYLQTTAGQVPILWHPTAWVETTRVSLRNAMERQLMEVYEHRIRADGTVTNATLP